MDALTFDSLDLAEVPVKLAGKDYVLVELTEEKHAYYRNYVSSISPPVTEGGTLQGNPQLWSADAYLISLCMFEEKSNGQPRLPVSVEFVRRLKRSISGALIERCEEMNCLGRFNPAVIEEKRKAEELRQRREQEAKN